MSLRSDELRAGDVLLLRSPGLVAWAVRHFDGSEVDRAALYLGAGRVAEVVGDAVVIRRYDDCVASAERVLARRLTAPADPEPVLARAEAGVSSASVTGTPEVLLALLCSSRKVRATASLRPLQRGFLQAAAAALPGPSPLLGAQFVWRCFEDALPEESDIYTVRLNDLLNLEVVSGVPVVPGAGVARRRGRGIHPESLLAWAAQPLVRSRLAGAAQGETGPALEDLLARYQAELRADAPVVQPARAETDALLGSLQKFAAAWSGSAPALARGALPPQLEMLFRGAADLCTAGDLLRSEDLFTL